MTDQPTTLAPVSVEQQGEVLEQVIMHGDLARLTPEQRIAYYRKVCDTLGLNPFTKPFNYISLSGKLTLYPTRDATDQLRRIHGISVDGMDRATDKDTGIHTVVARGHDRHGRTDEAMGAVVLGTLKGEALANALMKAETKAKRRLTLSLSGLGMFDESEISSIPDEVPVIVDDGDSGEIRTVTEVLASKLEAQKAARSVFATARTVVTEEEPTQLGIVSADDGPVEPPVEEEEDDLPDIPEVVPGQEPLPLDAPAELPPGARGWTGTLIGQPLEDKLESDDVAMGYAPEPGSEGLRLRIAVEQGHAVVALHGQALDDYYAQNLDAGHDGTQVAVTGFLRLVAWSKGGVPQQPYRRILATSIGKA